MNCRSPEITSSSCATAISDGSQTSLVDNSVPTITSVCNSYLPDHGHHLSIDSDRPIVSDSLVPPSRDSTPPVLQNNCVFNTSVSSIAAGSCPASMLNKKLSIARNVGLHGQPYSHQSVRFAKKNKLLNTCRRRLKRFLRTSSSESTFSNGPLMQAPRSFGGPTVDTAACGAHCPHLALMQAKYSALADEVASLRRQFAAVQDAFTSLRTMLLASFSVPTDRLDMPISLASDISSSVPTSSNNGVAVETLSRNSHSLSIEVSEAIFSTATPLSMCQAVSSITGLETTTDTSRFTTSTTWYPPISSCVERPDEHLSSHSCPGLPVVSSCAECADVSPADTEPLVSEKCDKLYGEDFKQLPKLEEPTTVTNAIPISHELTDTDTTNPRPVDTFCSPSAQLDTTLLVREVRRRLLLWNITRRRLSSELSGINYQTLSQHMRNPRPWSQLSGRARDVYVQLDAWLKRNSSANRMPAATNDDQANPITNLSSLQPGCLSPWTTSGTEESQDLLDELDHPVENTPPSPLEASISPNSFSSLPTLESATESERFAAEDTQQRSASILASVLTNLTATNENASFAPEQKRSHQLELETRRRISDILLAARKAMAEEEKTRGFDGDSSKRKKRCSSSDPKSTDVSLGRSCVSGANAFLPQLEQVASSNATLAVGTDMLTNLKLPLVQRLPIHAQPNRSSLPNLPTVMSTSIAPPIQNASSSTSVPVQTQAGPASIGLQSNVLTGQVSLSDLVHLLSAQVMNKKQTESNAHPPPITAIQLNRPLAQPSQTPKFSGESNIPTNSLPLASPLVQAQSLPVVFVPPGSISEPLIIGSSVPTILQVNAGTAPVASDTPAAGLLTPLQQTLLLLATATKQDAQRATADNTGENSLQFSEVSVPSAWREGESGKVNSGYQIENSRPSTSVHSAAGTLSSSKVIQFSQEFTSLLSSFNFSYLSTTLAEQLTSGLPELDVQEIRSLTKYYLQRHNISRRLLAEFLFGMSDAWAADLLDRTDHWSTLPPRLRFAYARLYVWLQQPNPMEHILNAIISRHSNSRLAPPSNAPNPPVIDLTSDQSAPDIAANHCNDLSGPDPLNSRKRPAPTQSIPGSRSTPNKLAKSEQLSSFIQPEDGNRSSDTLDEHERQSLFDIAKAATFAMQRAASSGAMRLAKNRSQVTDSPVKSSSSSRSNTPLKMDLLRSLGSDVDFNVKLPVLSPAKLSPGRNRVVFTAAQKEALVATFNRHPYPPVEKLRELAKDLDLNYKTVLHWFHNRRMRSPKPLLLSRTGADTSQSSTNETVTVDSAVNSLSAVTSCESGFNGNPTSSSYDNGTCATASHLGHSNRRKRPDPTRLLS